MSQEKPNMKDPFLWWGAVLIGVGVGFGGILGGALGGGAGAYIISLGKKKEMSIGKKVLMSLVTTGLAVVAYVVLVMLIFSAY